MNTKARCTHQYSILLKKYVSAQFMRDVCLNCVDIDIPEPLVDVKYK